MAKTYFRDGVLTSAFQDEAHGVLTILVPESSAFMDRLALERRRLICVD